MTNTTSASAAHSVSASASADTAVQSSPATHLAASAGLLSTAFEGHTRGGSLLDPSDGFIHRHIGPTDAELSVMLAELGYDSMDAFIRTVIPEDIRLGRELSIGPARGEHELLSELRSIASLNQIRRTYIGMGYHGTITPEVIKRNILENPGWYTQYTPYQAEISQGRLEALVNFQTMVSDLTGLPLANASLLDEGTAAAEAMAMCVAVHRHKKMRFVIDERCHPQVIAVVQTRADSMGVQLVVANAWNADLDDTTSGVLVPYPATDGRVHDLKPAIDRAHSAGVLAVVTCDLLALTMLTPPGELGADICVGSAQRFGVPMGFGGPHAAFLSTHTEHARRLPGRLVGVSIDSAGNPAYRLTIQTREQHIKRDRATSNICTAQVLLAIMSAMYACYHGPTGLRRIGQRVHAFTSALAHGLGGLGHTVHAGPFFDTIRVTPRDTGSVLAECDRRKINLRRFEDGSLGIALDETVTRSDLADLLACFGGGDISPEALESAIDGLADEAVRAGVGELPASLVRTSAFMSHPIFSAHDSETEMLRYISTLQHRDLSLAHSMIPLGSCTMKLNASSEMAPVTWPEFGNIHPFAPGEQTRGYERLFRSLERWLCEITGFSAVSLQPNAGSQGEYAGLMVIRAYHLARGDTQRDVCLIPESAHGTNPASAVIAGMRVIGIKTAANGDVDVEDLRAKAQQHRDQLAAAMITYPSTHGVFEGTVRTICNIVHEHGGRVYMDGANMNAQVGLCRPGDMGADVCHLNLHKTFCIPHGGGGPGMGPIGVVEDLRPFLPGHPVTQPGSQGSMAIGPISSAPNGSASILTISWMYIALMGSVGLRRATEVAILSANYMAKRLSGKYNVLFRGKGGTVAHEFILDCRHFQKTAGITVDDIAKRLMDYGFHAPTMSWPVAGTLMIEPTESEPKPELDRFCDAMLAIAEEIAEIERGEADQEDNVLKHAPHTAQVVTSDTWDRPYSRQRAAYPARWISERKFWPAVGRIDNPYGDRNLMCTCPPVSAMAEQA